MQPLDNPLQAPLQTSPNGRRPELQPFLQQRPDVKHPGSPVQADHVHIYAVTSFQIRGCKKMVHQRCQFHSVRSGFDHQAGRVFVIRFVAQIADQRQLFSIHLRRDLLQNLRTGDLIGQRVDYDVAIFTRPGCPLPHGSRTGLVDLPDLLFRGYDFGVSGVIRSLDMLAQFGQRGAGRLQQPDAGRHHLPDVVRRNIRRHSDGDPGAAVQQHVGQARRQGPGLIQCTVEVGRPIHGPLSQLVEQGIGVPCQSGFRVPHGGKRFGVVG